MNTTLLILKLQFKIKHFKLGLVAYVCSPSTSRLKEAEESDQKFGVILGYITSIRLA